MSVNQYVGTRLPPAIIKQITEDVESGIFNSPAEWVRVACREFCAKRIRESAGGGGLN